ncbi:MAG TPA: hypothetical protein VGR61_08820 [Candidatus Dormibacteraeota bacterium]|nr:hypothetical protein [Candidatus Dormibacteraeota bacterium]
MSSLPPYNPSGVENLVWFVPVGTPDDLPTSLPQHAVGWTAAFLDDQALVAGVSTLCPGAALKVDPGPGPLDIPGDGWSAVLGQPAFVERALRRVMGMPDGTARFVVMIGALSLVQLLPGRAVLKHLNAGQALTDLRQ